MAKDSRRMICVLRDDSSGETLPDGNRPFAGFAPNTAREGGGECTGPSLAFVPLRDTKDRAQDDSLKLIRIKKNRVNVKTLSSIRVFLDGVARA